MSEKVFLRPLTWQNVGDILECEGSESKFYDLPTTGEEAEGYVCLAEEGARSRMVFVYNAYDNGIPGRIVGGGQIVNLALVANLSYWVVAARRRQGYGSAILNALAVEAEHQLPECERLELTINPRNVGSAALAGSCDYELLYTAESGNSVYGKPLR